MIEQPNTDRAIVASTSHVGAGTLVALGNLFLVLGVLGAVALIIAIAVLGMETDVPNWVVVAGIAGAASSVANGFAVWAVLHWFGNSHSLLEAIHSNLYQLTERALSTGHALD